MHLFVFVQVLLELDGTQHASTRKFVEFLGTSVVDEVFLLHWDFLP